MATTDLGAWGDKLVWGLPEQLAHKAADVAILLQSNCNCGKDGGRGMVGALPT